MTKEIIVKSLVVLLLFIAIIGGISVLPILLPAILSSILTLLPFIGLIALICWIGNIVCKKL